MTAVQSAITATGGGATASLDGTGRLRVTTTHEGSAATIQVTGGNALASLGLATDGAAIAGTDGAVQIGTNAVTTVTSAGIGGTVAVVDRRRQPHLRRQRRVCAPAPPRSPSSRPATAASLRSPPRSTAPTWARPPSAVKVVRRQLAPAGELEVHRHQRQGARSTTRSFAGIGGLIQTSAAQDARITIGSGPGAYSVTSSSNVVQRRHARREPHGAHRVGHGGDRQRRHERRLDGRRRQQPRDAAINSVLADINLQTKYDAEDEEGVAAVGRRRHPSPGRAVRNAVTSLVGDATNGLASTDRHRRPTRRQPQVRPERSSSRRWRPIPAAVERLFARGGSSTNGAIVRHGHRQDAGRLVRRRTSRPPRPERPPATSSSAARVAGQRIGVRVGVDHRDRTTQLPAPRRPTSSPGSTPPWPSAGLKVNAEESGGGVRLTAVGYGGSGVVRDEPRHRRRRHVWATNTGTDVVGTIDGQTHHRRRAAAPARSTPTTRRWPDSQVDVDEGAHRRARTGRLLAGHRRPHS